MIQDSLAYSGLGLAATFPFEHAPCIIWMRFDVPSLGRELTDCTESTVGGWVHERVQLGYRYCNPRKKDRDPEAAFSLVFAANHDDTREDFGLGRDSILSLNTFTFPSKYITLNDQLLMALIVFET